MGRVAARTYEVAPSAGRLTESLRDIGYDFQTAVADLVDNSVAAGATRIDVDIEFSGSDSWVTVADDGHGMSAGVLLEALRFGTRRDYARNELGRYGLGLKTAPLSQCRRLTVVTRKSRHNRVITRRTLDLDLVRDSDSWLIVEDAATHAASVAERRLESGPGTVVIWEKLDRVLPANRPDGGWARRRMLSLAKKTTDHLALVFHRFLEGGTGVVPLTITVNGEKVQPWNPFAPDEPATIRLPDQEFEMQYGQGSGTVRLKRFVLPPKDAFSSLAEWERLSGPLKWNRQQGLYFYRASRLVYWGGWGGVRGIDEHTKLARAVVDFDTDLDDVFHINVAKMKVALPSGLKSMIERPINELCLRADDIYRKAGSDTAKAVSAPVVDIRSAVGPAVGLALRSAAMELGHGPALREILDLVAERDKGAAGALGLS